MNNELHFSSKSNEWETPQELFNSLDNHYHFTLDVCATPENAKCKKFFTQADNGLIQDWSNDICFMNPPYGKEIGKWMEKAYSSNATVICLVPARTDTRWWHDFAMNGTIRFLKGRLKFNGHKNSAPFPSAIVIFKKVRVN